MNSLKSGLGVFLKQGILKPSACPLSSPGNPRDERRWTLGKDNHRNCRAVTSKVLRGRQPVAGRWNSRCVRKAGEQRWD